MPRPTFDQWIQTAREDNPGMAEQELSSFYRENYGGGPTEDDFSAWAGRARAAFPDEEHDEGALRSSYSRRFGDIEEVSDVSRALSAAWSETKALGGGLVGLAGETVGLEGVRDWGLKTYEEQMQDVAGLQRPQYGIDYLTEQGDLGDWVDALQYHGVKGLTSLVGGLGAGLVARTGVKTAVKRKFKDFAEDELAKETVEKAAKRGFAGGIGGYSVGQELGSIYPEAVEEAERTGGEVDLTKVYGFGTAAGAVEGLSNVAMLGLAGMSRFLPSGLRMAGFAPEGGRFAKAGKALTGSVLVEAGEEGLQNPLEYLGANKELGTEDFWAEQRQSMFAGAAGGVGGGGLVMLPHLLSPRALPEPEPEPAPVRGEGLDLRGLREGVPTQEAVDRLQPGLREREEVTEKQYAKGFEEAFSEPSGVIYRDPETQVERELTVGEAMHREATGELPGAQQPVAPEPPPEPMSVKDIVNQVTGVSREATAGRGKIMKELMEQPSGAFVVDEDQIEHELNVGDKLHRDLFGVVPEPVKTDHEQVLQRLSDEGRASVVNKKNPKTVIKKVRDLHHELQKLDTDTREGAVAARDWFAIYDEKASKRNISRASKATHAMDELVESRKAELGMTGQAPMLETVFSGGEASEAFITLAHELLDKTPGLTPKEGAAVRLAFGIEVPGVVVPEAVREKDGQVSFRAVGKLMEQAGVGVKEGKGHEKLAKPLIESAVEKITKANPSAESIMVTYMEQVRAIARRKVEDEVLAEAEGPGISESITEADLGEATIDPAEIREGGMAVRKGMSQVSLDEKGEAALPEEMSVTAKQASDEVRQQYLEEHKVNAISELSPKEKKELKGLRKQAEQEVQVEIDRMAEVQAAEKEMLAEQGVGELGDVPLTSEEALHEAVLEEQQRVIEEARAAENERVVANREQLAQALWKVSTPELPWATASVEEQDAIYAAIIQLEELPESVQQQGRAAIVTELRKSYADQTTTIPDGERAADAGRDAARDTEVAGAEVTAGEADIQSGEPVPEIVIGDKPIAGVSVKTKRRRRVVKPEEDISYGETAVDNPTDRESFTRTIKSAIGRKANWRIHVYDTVEEAVADGVDPETLTGYSEARGKQTKTMGWVRSVEGLRHATFILEHIPSGRELGAFMHEVGVHLGLESVLPLAQQKRLSTQVRQWATADTTSTENVIAKRARKRVEQANVPEHKVDQELIAYFIEEAVNMGVDPTAIQEKGALARWFDTVWKSFHRALTKLGLKTEDMTAQDFVDLALGAAQIELSDPETIEVRGDESISYSEVIDPAASDTKQPFVNKNINRLPKEFRPAVRAITDTVRSAAQKVVTNLAFLKDLGDYAERKIPALKPHIRKFLDSINATKVERVKREKAITDVLNNFQKLPNETGNMVRDRANSFLLQSRLKRAWGYVPAWNRSVIVDPKMAKRFAALTSEAQHVVMDVHRVMHENLEIKNELINKRITDTFDVRIAAAKDATEKQKIQEEKETALKAFGRTLSELEGPYSPLKRHGKFIVQAHSDEMAKARSDKKWDEVEKLRLDPSHYALEFVESRLEARKREQALQEEGFSNVDYWGKAEWRENPVVGLHEVERLRSYIAGQIEDESSERSKQLLNMAEDLALRVMSEEHARQSAQHSGDIRGADKDMMRSFVVQGRADAHYIANLNHLSETNDAVNSIAGFVESTEKRASTGLGRDELTRITNALYWHWGKSMDYQETPLLDRMAAVSSAWYLLFSPAYYLQNATQVGMMSVPYMAGRFGWVNSMKETGHAYADVKEMVMSAGKFEHFDTTKVPDDVKKVVEELLNRGTIDITMDFELGQVAQTGEGPISQAQRKFDETVRRLPAKVEVMNRVVTAIAAYRLSKNYPDQKYPDKVKAHEHSVNYAAKVIDVTHGDYDAVNTPKFISPKFIPGAKVLFQFRKFQLIQLAYLTRMFTDAFAGENADVKRVARRQLLFTFGHFGALAGGLGLPGMTFMQGLASLSGSLFGDEDEPWDSDAQVFAFRKAATNIGLPESMIDILTNGIPTALGMNLTSRIGAQNVVSLLPYIRADVREYDGYEKLLAAALGPSASLGKKVMWSAPGQVAAGNYYKALETALPAGLMRGTATVVRQAIEGETAFNGDQVLTPEEIDLWGMMQTTLGLSSPQQQKRYEKQRLLRSYQDTFNQRTSDLKREFSEARKDKDTARQRKLRNEWKDLQKTKREAGFRPAPLSDLLKAPVAQRKREQQVEAGIKYSRGTRGFVEELSRVYGE